MIPKKKSTEYSDCGIKNIHDIQISNPIIDSAIATIENVFTVFCLYIFIPFS